MDINSLTLGEAAKIASLFGGGKGNALAVPEPQAERPVIVCTEHRGVFFGYATDTSGETIKLRAARMCIYWSSKTGGVMGLASDGPTDAVANGSGSRIGAAADAELRKITAVFPVTDAATAVWASAPIYRDR